MDSVSLSEGCDILIERKAEHEHDRGFVLKSLDRSVRCELTLVDGEKDQTIEEMCRPCGLCYR